MVEVSAVVSFLGVCLGCGRGRGGRGGLPAGGDASGRIEADLDGGSGGKPSTSEVEITCSSLISIQSITSS